MLDSNPAKTQLIDTNLESVEHFGVGGWQFQFANGVILNVHSVWRLLSGRQIEITSEDDGQKFGLTAPIDAAAQVIKLIGGNPVADVCVEAISADLTIVFSVPLRLEVINDSSGFEAWTIAGKGVTIVGRNGES